MAFFDLPADDELPDESRALLEEYRLAQGAPKVSDVWRTYGRHPKIIEARFKAFQNLNYAGAFGWDARMMAVMLIAHTKRCRACFAGSRFQLDKLGFDEAALDNICDHPDTLPLKERDRLFVHYALRIATSAADLTPKDFREMADRGFSRDEVQEMIAFSAYWVMNMVFSQAGLAALQDD